MLVAQNSLGPVCPVPLTVRGSVKIFRPLPHTNLPPRVVGAVVEKADGGVAKMMVESMFADASQ